MPQATLFDRAIDNHGLFSDHFLEDRLGEGEHVRALKGEADAAFDAVRRLVRSHAAEFHTWNEAQTEDRFTKPVLELLGWERHVQPHAQRQGRSGRPNYALFTSTEQRRLALEHTDGDEMRVFHHADAVADAKYWGGCDEENGKRARAPQVLPEHVTARDRLCKTIGSMGGRATWCVCKVHHAVLPKNLPEEMLLPSSPIVVESLALTRYH